MKILITNDDSVGAEQLLPLVRWFQQKGEVTVVVPKVEQSGKSHGIELHTSFEVKQMELAPDVKAWVVDSTPADCIRWAVLGMKWEFDLAISGINRGLNVGSDMMYSGTVAAACEAVNLGIPAIAISAPPKYYDEAVTQLDCVFDFFTRHRLMEQHRLYNVNIPCQSDEIRITRQGGPYYSDDFHAIENDHYLPKGKSVWVDRGDRTLDTDTALNGAISVTPLTIEKTDLAVYQKLAALTP